VHGSPISEFFLLFSYWKLPFGGPTTRNIVPVRGYPQVGGMRLAQKTDKTQSHEKRHFGGENPAALS
jgi:hypothetical protein